MGERENGRERKWEREIKREGEWEWEVERERERGDEEWDYGETNKWVKVELKWSNDLRETKKLKELRNLNFILGYLIFKRIKTIFYILDGKLLEL